MTQNALPPFSLSQLTALDHNPPQLVGLAARTGYSHAGIRLLPAAPGGIAYPLMDDDALLAETLAVMADTGVRIFDLEMIRLDAGFDPARYGRFFEVGQRLGAQCILVAGDDGERARLIDAYGRLCEAARPYGLCCDLEFMPWTAVVGIGDAIEVVSAVRADNAGVLIDALHLDRSGGSATDIARVQREWLHYAQICDGPAERPTTPEGLIHAARCERLLPGEGAIDLDGIWRALPRELPVGVEVPNDIRAPQLGAEGWARAALEAARAIVSRAPTGKN
ncbi:sugar phosphate isomerase/epimerase family protein [Thauera sp. SDU_THAU2]|uniref:sugar phosphate isomerase/epimerase family protein n=1 Tax=Thauera sp. SDU_THAU2 TaxID=3136633 RepID=UPI00311D6FB2